MSTLADLADHPLLGHLAQCADSGCSLPALDDGVLCPGHLAAFHAEFEVDQILGSALPRLWTRPLRTLTPDTSAGFECIAFAEQVLQVRLLPWQRWWLIHALELRADGRFRFRTILTLVARQQGKTTLLKIVALWAMYLGRARLVLGAAQSLDIARESWTGAVELATGIDELADEVAAVRYANGEQCLTLINGSRYRITAATRAAGRGLSVDLLVLDELREHRTADAWAALSKTTLARPGALIVGISNAGDDDSVVLNQLRSAALADADEQLGIFEWSAPDGCALDDLQAWAQAMPGLGITISEAAVRTALATDPPAVFRTELLCQHVSSLENAVDPAAWKACADRTGTLEAVRDRLAVCVDVAPDGAHVTLAGAALLPDGRVRVEILGAWTSVAAADRDLPLLVEQIRPADVGWFPNAPVGALGATLRGLRRNVRRLLARVDPNTGRVVSEDEHEATQIAGAMDREACQGLADLVAARRILHPADPLLDAHIAGAGKVNVADGWRFTRRGAGHVDAAYAAAGAVHLARLLSPQAPPPRPKAF